MSGPLPQDIACHHFLYKSKESTQGDQLSLLESALGHQLGLLESALGHQLGLLESDVHSIPSDLPSPPLV